MSAAEEDRRQLNRAVTASVVGTAIEWYDFFLYGSAAALVFPKLFFPNSDPLAGTLIAFGTFAVGFAARPIGAVIFGHFGDRIGRKATLVVTLLTMGLATTCIGLVPSYASIGIWGGVLLTILRVFQGIGVGGEWGGSVLISMEWGSIRRRGLISSWPQMGVPIGLVLGNGALLLMSGRPEFNFLEVGWRLPFLLSFVLVGIGLFVRLGVLETPTFVRLLEERRIERQPVLRAFALHPREIFTAMFVRVSEQAPFYIFTSFALAYGTKTLKLGSDFMLFCVFTGSVVSLLTVPLAGYLSDRFGRKLIYGVGVVAVGAVAFPYFGALESRVGWVVLLGVVLALIPHDLQYGPQAALIAENFTGRVRYSGASIGYQLASVVAGGPAPLIATYLLATYQSTVPIALYIVGCAVVGLIALFLMPDRQAVDHNAEFASPAARGRSLTAE